MTQQLPTAEPDDETRALRADIYRLLGRLLREPPDEALLAWLTSLAPEGDGDLARGWQGLAQAAGEATPAALARAHFRHLVGVIEGDVTPYASWYRQGALMDEALVALRRDLRRLGIARAEHSRDPEDHLAAELEVMALLVETSPHEEAGFYRRHLAPWADRCLADLAAVDTPFHARLGELGRAFLAEEARRLAAIDGEAPVRFVTPPVS
ncbi:TorD/DmsD family molecular chaperone [Halomonas stenophila]|uniref:TorA maturation chaperone TorD n=1 Tax=Halomonas stenophila TaxID=795312 RepID=A0A7W5ESJ4_9GAMM|nr:molecular chaperone TorD family protein [Halomonas stenophila]MBB3229876.1 TorA maturation chaperone TorD [Halomonas stenophila]